MEYPAWLNASYVEKILQNDEKDESIKVSDITVKAATAKGDNYGSDMYRVIVNFASPEIQKSKSLIVKTEFQDAGRNTMVDPARLFATEMSMMSKTLPQMNKILENVWSMSLAARCLHVQYERPFHLIIEDLAPRGFQQAVFPVGLDLDHCLLAIRNLAAFHAASVALKEKDPMALTNYTEGLFHKNHSTLRAAFFVQNTRALGEEAAKWPELSPRISEKILKMAETIYERGCEAAIYQKDDFNVLNHADFWKNNMMFRYDKDQKPIDHIFVDFQISFYGSPAIDILTFLATSASYDVRVNHRELVLREYHNLLSKTMAKLECNTEAPSYDSLQDILRKRGLCEVIHSFSSLPHILSDRSQDTGLNELLSQDGGYKNQAHQGELYRKIMIEALPLYESMGLLDA